MKIFDIIKKWFGIKPKFITRSQLLQKSLDLFLKRHGSGLCFCIIHTLERYNLLNDDLGYIDNLNMYFPEFKPPKGLSYGNYWWPLEDKASRIEYLKKLIEYYKNDNTLYKI